MAEPEPSQPGASPILKRELQKSLSCKSCKSCQNVCFLIAAGPEKPLACMSSIPVQPIRTVLTKPSRRGAIQTGRAALPADARTL